MQKIIGRATKLGVEVSMFKVGDLARVGCLVDSCRTCAPCADGLEQFCENGPALTYNGTEMDRKTPTFGAYSTQILMNERYALRIPAGREPAAAAPLLCAGITTYSPFKQFDCKKGDKVGVVGLSLIGGNRRLAGSMIGGIAETPQMLDHCAKHGIMSDVRARPHPEDQRAYERVLKSDVRYRFVIDIASLRH